MTTAREVLALIITGDGRGAISEIEKVGGAAERELGRTDDRLALMGSRLTTWGAAAVGTGTLAAMGLYGAAQAAGQLDANIGRIEGNFGSAADGALRFVENANGIGLSDQAAAQYVANIGELAVGLGIGQEAAAGMTTETVRLVSQLALLKGQAPADGLEAVSAGLIGEYDSLQRLVPAISAAAIQERALADTRKASADDLTAAEKATATFEIVTESARETLARSGDVTETNAYKAAMLAAAYGDLKTQAGDAALPVLQDITEVLTDGAEAISSANEASNGLVANLATYATIGAIAGGGLSFVAGQGTKVYKTFTDLDGPLRTTEGGFTRTGTAATVLGASLTGLTVGVAIVDALNRSAVGAAGSVTELQAALADSTGERMTQTLDQILLEIDGKSDSIGDVVNGLLTNAKLDPRGLFGDGAVFEDDRGLKAVKDDLEALATVDPKGAQELLDAVNRAVDSKPDFFPNAEARDEWNELSGAVQETIDTQRIAASSTSALAGEQSELTAEVNTSTEAFKDRLDPILELLDAQQRLQNAEERLAEAADTNGRDVQQASRAVADARQSVVDATRDLSEAQAELNDVLNDDPMFGLRSVSPEDEIADARARLAEANRLLAANPGNGLALTMRDTAVLDLEDASRRQQDERRNAEQRADDIANAQRAVEDAQRGLADANRGVVDAQGRLAEVQSQHGINSDEYADAAQAVIEANIGVRVADEELAQYLEDNGIAAVTELNDQLDRWIAQGGPVGEAAAAMKAQIAPLVEQYLVLGSAVGQLNAQYVDLIRHMIDSVAWAGRSAGAAAAAGAAAVAGSATGLPGAAVTPGYWDLSNEERAAMLLGGADGDPTTPMSTGGLIGGPGTGQSDDVLIAASRGEAMLKATTVAALGPAAVAQLNQTGRWPEIARNDSAGAAVVTREGDLIFDGVHVNVVARDDQLAGAAVVETLRGVARRSGRGLRASRKLVGG